MQAKTRGIILHSIKYADNSTIVTIYTEQFGRVAYRVYGQHNKKSKLRSAFLQALQPVMLDVYHVPSKEIQSIKDVSITASILSISADPVKNAIALFAAELLYRTLQTSEADSALFEFLENAVAVLENCSEGQANFHLIFMLKLTRYLGFEPNLSFPETAFFDMINGVCTAQPPSHPHVLTQETSEMFLKAMRCNFSDMGALKLGREQRYILLEHICDYYRLHVAGFKGLKSLPVLHDLFS